MEKTPQSFSIKQWDEADRPREKMIAQGAKMLSNAELFAIIIGSGTEKESAIQLMQKILASTENDINKLYQLSLDRLTQFKGIGFAKAVKIKAALELGKRFDQNKVKKIKTFTSSKDAFDTIRLDIADLIHEEFWVLYLNRAGHLLRKVCISKGGFSKTVVDIKIVLKKALELNASAMVLAHNHPSGNIIPSELDVEVTQKIKGASQSLDISLLDHIIVSGEKYYSFLDQNRL